MEEIKTDSINLIATANDGGQSVLYVGLKEAYRDKPQYERYLRKEFEKSKALDNPNIFRLLEISETENYGLAIKTEWEDSRTLAQWLKEADHNDEEKKRIIRQVASALSYMHSQGVVHGGLNSHNIFITRKGDNVKLLLVHLRYVDSLKQPEETLKYIAPEAKDGTVGLNPRADIFSLGVLLKDLGLGDEYHSVITTSCSFGRNDRFDSVESFLEAFDRRHYTRTPAEEETASQGPSSSRMRIIILAAIAIAIAIAVPLIVHNSSESTADNQQTEQTDSAANNEQNNTDEQQAAAQPAPDTTQQTAPTDQAAPADQTAQGEYTGDEAFLNDLLPQMKADLDKIYAQAPDPETAQRKVAIYYKGLRNVLRKRHLKIAQLDAFDKAFAAYIQQKKQ
jgi:serine/threonine-protein kinase